MWGEGGRGPLLHPAQRLSQGQADKDLMVSWKERCWHLQLIARSTDPRMPSTWLGVPAGSMAVSLTPLSQSSKAQEALCRHTAIRVQDKVNQPLWPESPASDCCWPGKPLVTGGTLTQRKSAHWFLAPADLYFRKSCSLGPLKLVGLCF